MKKNGKCNQYDFLQLLSKFSWATFKKFSKLYQPWGLSRDHCWKGGLEEIHDFRDFWNISQRVFGFFMKSFLVIRSYQVLVVNIKSLDMGSLVIMGTRLKVLIYAEILTIWGIF